MRRKKQEEYNNVRNKIIALEFYKTLKKNPLELFLMESFLLKCLINNTNELNKLRNEVNELKNRD